ncbi:protein phosphatase 2 (formerly 2A), catalytic subunit [Strigomonas culicis]|uniref:Protein phosphatase 2 (Formerly 2A), catalytic subunit n=1 Tax=Strigomonas culicis TaxID=28005 RepID=S9TW22_9TRYP|nr:protein phosphatase 2 (formerly 2A), catalytic subunit [Strigomonas culicis]|eukprot:EPY20798.1 protein phosphatase 2 (formerly 2A), catalytic subunit [Strigomonas culicis]
MDKVLSRYFTKQTQNSLQKELSSHKLASQEGVAAGESVLSPLTVNATPKESTTVAPQRSPAAKDAGPLVAAAAGLTTLVSHIDPRDSLMTPDSEQSKSPVRNASRTDIFRPEEDDASPPLPQQDAAGQGVSSEAPAFAGSPMGAHGTPFYSAPPSDGRFLGLIDFILMRGQHNSCDRSFECCTTAEQEKIKRYFSLRKIESLCDAVTPLLIAEPNILDIHIDESETLVVVGDIHGQFSDMFASVLCQQYSRELNPNREDRRFLFLGDLVDRGPHSLDVILLVFALKVEYPRLVYITRGNHEESKTSRVYGFLTEMESKLGSEGNAAWSKINSVFRQIPLCAAVQTPHMRFFATHGGLSPAIHDDINTIEELERQEYCGKLTGEQEDIVNGLLWSDPTTDTGLYKRNPRGCGVLFGPAASSTFCSRNGYNFICRAHQVVNDGFLWRHQDKVVTVFSAPNYCGINGNLGAVMVIEGTATKPAFVQYECFEDLMDDWKPPPTGNFPYSSCFM